MALDSESMNMDSMRDLFTLKENLAEKSAAYKLIHRAEQILGSDEFLAKKEKSRKYLESVKMLDETFEARIEALAIDMAEREDEKNVDFMQFERAGLSIEEQAQIKKLDETNHLCYKYLRDHGSMWQYDPAKTHPCLKARLYRRFDSFDNNSDGIITIDEVLMWADRMRSVCDAADEEVEMIREALRYYFNMYGLGEGGLCRENWVEAHVVVGEAAKERERQGDPSPMGLLEDTYFNVIDEDQNGILNMKELKNMMNVFRLPEEAAYTFFEAADTNEDGELDRDEMHQLFYRYWFGEYDSNLDNVFAYKY